MKISMMTYTMARGAWGARANIAQMCNFCSELGIDAIDCISIYGHDPAHIRRTTDSYGIKNICYTFSGNDIQSNNAADRARGVAGFDAELDIAETLGAEIVMIVLPGEPDVPKAECQARCIEALNILAQKAAPRGITVTTEHFSTKYAPFGTSADMNLLVKEVPGMKVAYDNGNMFLQGVDPVQGFVNSHEYIVHAHFKDWNEAPSGLLSANGKHYQGALVGEGEMDTLGCLRAMVKHGYNGYINLEYEGNDYSPELAMRKGVPILNGLIRQAKGE